MVQEGVAMGRLKSLFLITPTGQSAGMMITLWTKTRYCVCMCVHVCLCVCMCAYLQVDDKNAMIVFDSRKEGKKKQLSLNISIKLLSEAICLLV